MLFANLLPGLRELRAPLAAGYIALAVCWAFTVGEIPAEQEATGVAETLYDIKGVVGAAGLGAVLTFAAYVLGSVIADAATAIYGIASTATTSKGRWKRSRHDPDAWVEPLESRPLELSWRGSRALKELVQRAWSDVAGTRESSEDDVAETVARALGSTAAAFYVREAIRGSDRELPESPMSTAQIELEHRTADELDLVLIRLLGREPELHSAIDRLRAESELRLALVLSGALVLAFFLSREVWWAAVATAALMPLLLAQAVARRRSAGDQLMDALALQRVQAPTVERFLGINGIRWSEEPTAAVRAPHVEHGDTPRNGDRAAGEAPVG